MNEMDYDSLIAHIYTSYTLLSRWQETIRRIAAHAGFDGGKLISIVPGALYVAGSHPYYSGIASLYGPEGPFDDPRLSRYLERNAENFVPDHVLCSAEEIRQSKLYEKILEPNRIQGSIGCAFRFGNRRTTAIVFDTKDRKRTLDQSRIDTLNAIGIHLRAAIRGVHEQQDRLVNAVLSYMDTHGEALATLDEAGTIQIRNGAFQKLVSPHIAHVAELADKTDAGTAEAVRTAVSLIGRADDAAMRSIRVPPAELGSRSYTRLRIIPSRRTPGDIFHVPGAFLHLADEPLENDELVRINSNLFNFTRTEGEIAVALSGGETPAEIAARTGVSVATVRTHIRAIFRKTGSHRKAELIAKLYR